MNWKGLQKCVGMKPIAYYECFETRRCFIAIDFQLCFRVCH